jgi:hypothetical protein
VGGDLLQHVIEEADAGLDLEIGPSRVEVDGADDAGLLGVADGLSGAVDTTGCGAEAEGGEEPVVDLGFCRDRQPQPLAGAFGGEAETGEGGEDGVRVGGAGHDHGSEARLDRHVSGEGLDQPLALRPGEGDAGRRLHNPRGVECLQGEADGDLGQGVGLQHRGEAGEGVGLAEGGTDAGTGEAVCQRQAAQHDQVRVVADHGRGGGGVGKLDHAFVDDQQDRGDKRTAISATASGEPSARRTVTTVSAAAHGNGRGVQAGEGAVRLSVGCLDAQPLSRAARRKTSSSPWVRPRTGRTLSAVTP